MTYKEIIRALECIRPWILTEKERMALDNALDLINRQQSEIEDLNHSIDTLGRVKEQLKENLSETEAKYQKEITRLDALLVCKNKVIRSLEKSFENAYDGAIKEFAEGLKEHLKGNGGLYCVTTMNAQIDNLVKEMVGEQDV